MRKFVAFALGWTLVFLPAAPLSAGQNFDPFPPGNYWYMVNTSNGDVTTFEVLVPPAGYTFGCFTQDSNQSLRYIQIVKQQAATYWFPGTPENVEYYFWEDPTFGPTAFAAVALDFSYNIVATDYLVPDPGYLPPDILVPNSGAGSYSTSWAYVSDTGQTNRCIPPGSAGLSYTSTWSTTFTSETRSTPVYTGPVNCSFYQEGNESQGVLFAEKWCFAANPVGSCNVPMLVELDDSVNNGAPIDIVLQTKGILGGPCGPYRPSR